MLQKMQFFNMMMRVKLRIMLKTNMIPCVTSNDNRLWRPLSRRKKLKKNKKYYVRFKIYQKDPEGNGYLYSDWSKAKSVKTK